jgi:thiamine biosynthesis lipoprotein
MKGTTICLCLFLLSQLAKSKACAQEILQLTGFTMGTSYHVAYFDINKRDFKDDIDSILSLVNKSISNYDTCSEITLFNNSKSGITFQSAYLYPIFKTAYKTFTDSHGAFDPTVMPLVNAWGFGPKKLSKPSAVQIDSIMRFVGFEKISLTRNGILKKDPRVQLDFGGIGQGFGADVVADFLRANNIENFLVEIGGEGMAVGENIAEHRAWQIGILDPNSTRENQFFKAYVSITNRSFTTSGNYFNYREIDGKKYGHTLDPKTGYPVQHELLSVSLFSDDCTTADAWATALMVMGLQEAITALKNLPDIDALLIYSTPSGAIETFITPRLKSSIRFEP